MMLELSKDSMRTGVGICRSRPRFSMAPCVFSTDFSSRLNFCSRLTRAFFYSQIDKLFFFSTLGFENLGIHQGLNGFFVNILRNQNLIGNQVRFFLIELSHIGQEVLIRIIVIGKEIDIPLNEFP